MKLSEFKELTKNLPDDTDILLRTTLEIKDGSIVCDSIWVHANLLNATSDKILDYERFSKEKLSETIVLLQAD